MRIRGGAVSGIGIAATRAGRVQGREHEGAGYRRRLRP